MVVLNTSHSRQLFHFLSLWPHEWTDVSFCTLAIIIKCKKNFVLKNCSLALPTKIFSTKYFHTKYFNPKISQSTICEICLWKEWHATLCTHKSLRALSCVYQSSMLSIRESFQRCYVRSAIVSHFLCFLTQSNHGPCSLCSYGEEAKTAFLQVLTVVVHILCKTIFLCVGDVKFIGIWNHTGVHCIRKYMYMYASTFILEFAPGTVLVVIFTYEICKFLMFGGVSLWF